MWSRRWLRVERANPPSKASANTCQRHRLASRSFSEGWCRLQESNPRPTVYKTAALPTELSRPELLDPQRETPRCKAKHYYLMRRRVGLPPPAGFFGGSGVVGAGSAAV